MSTLDKKIEISGDEYWNRGDINYDSVFIDKNIVKSQTFIMSTRIVENHDDTFTTRETLFAEPGGVATFYASGPVGRRITITLERDGFGNGGHRHPGGPTGSIAPSDFIIAGRYPQNIPCVFMASEVSGSINVTASINTAERQEVRHMVVVRLHNLVALLPSRGIVLTGATDTHPYNFFGTIGLVDKITRLGEAYWQEYRKPIYVNDMSLEWGGLFDHRANWSPPHSTHRDGRNADINSRSMNEEQKAFFRQKSAELGLRVVEHGNPLHWHVTG